MPATILEIIRNASREIQGFLALACTDSAGRPLDPAEIQKLMNRLQQIGKILEGGLLPNRHEPEMKAEMEKYMRNLEQLPPVLERVRNALLQRRARMEAEQAQVNAAGKWAAVYRDTV